MTSDDPDEPVLPRYLQLLWGREPAGRRGPRPGRTIEEIGAAAVRLADDAGLDAVSMKSVAAELAMTPMSLYRYVDSKDELLEVMVDLAYGYPDPRSMSRGGWRRRLTIWGQHLCDALVAHPWISSVPILRPPLTPRVISWTDAGVRCFADLPLTGQEKLSSLLVLDGYVRSIARLAVSMGLTSGRPAVEERQYERELALLVDPQRFPALAGAADALTDGRDFLSTELAFGVGLILDGVEALAALAEPAR